MTDQLAPVRGVGAWIWELASCDGGNAPAIAARCKAHHVEWVAIKAQDGGWAWDQWQAPIVNALRGAGIRVLAWGYNYGADATAELAAAHTALSRVVPDGWLCDAEQELEAVNTHSPGAADAFVRTFCGGLRLSYPQMPLYLSTFPIVTYHQALPFGAFREYCAGWMPQIYHQSLGRTPAAAVEWTRASIAAMPVLAGWPVIPTAQCYSVSALEVSQFAAAVAQVWPTVGVNAWSYQHMGGNDALWEGLASQRDVYHAPPPPPKPQPVPDPTPTQADYQAAAWVHAIDALASGVKVVDCVARKSEIAAWVKAHP